MVVEPTPHAPCLPISCGRSPRAYGQVAAAEPSMRLDIAASYPRSRTEIRASIESMNAGRCIPASGRSPIERTIDVAGRSRPSRFDAPNAIHGGSVVVPEPLHSIAKQDDGRGRRSSSWERSSGAVREGSARSRAAQHLSEMLVGTDGDGASSRCTSLGRRRTPSSPLRYWARTKRNSGSVTSSSFSTATPCKSLSQVERQGNECRCSRSNRRPGDHSTYRSGREVAATRVAGVARSS